MPKDNIPNDEIQRLLRTIFDDCYKEDNAVRERQVRAWRRLKLLWEGFQRVWYSEVAHDWRVAPNTESSDDGTQGAYDHPINVYKAYLESIIAALSVSIPSIKCFPDDAENTLDLITARSGDKIAELVYRHNDVALLWLHGLFVFVTEGMTACYDYSHSSKEYGEYDDKEYDEIEEEHEITQCSNCGHIISDTTMQPEQQMQQPVENTPLAPNPALMGPTQGNPFDANNPSLKMNSTDEIDEFMPDNEDSEIQYNVQYKGADLCPACMMQMDPEIRREKFSVTRLIGVTREPKSRICLEVYGGLNVKIPNHVKKQKDLPYLIFSEEKDYTSVIEEYGHLHGNEKILKCVNAGRPNSSYNYYESWARLSPQYLGEYPINVITVHKAWIRPCKFNLLGDEADVKKLKKKYPNGVCITYVDDQFAEATNASLDDNWTILENPMADYLHYEPAGQGLVSIQEITNDLTSLVLQTIEHGIGQTFADPAVLDFTAYGQTEVTPGGIFPAKPKSGKSLNDGFMELKTATLSQEVMPFSTQVQSMAQLTSGALPSLFGGNMEGTETASQYSMSRAQALQRQQNTWKMFTIWWKRIFGKVIPLFIKEMKDDERDVQRDKQGNFINTMIRKSEVEGRIGKIELDAGDTLPLTWSARKDVIEKLLQNSNPEIIQILTAPENRRLIHESLGIPEFYVPGEDDVTKQNAEITILLNSMPIETGDMMNPEISSVEIDPVFDNHNIEFECCRKWICSEIGRQAKVDNEQGYRNVLLHGKMHLQQIQMAAMQQQQMEQQSVSTNKPSEGNSGDGNPNPGQQSAPNSKPKQNTQTPITGDANVPTIQ